MSKPSKGTKLVLDAAFVALGVVAVVPLIGGVPDVGISATQPAASAQAAKGHADEYAAWFREAHTRAAREGDASPQPESY